MAFISKPKKVIIYNFTFPNGQRIPNLKLIKSKNRPMDENPNNQLIEPEHGAYVFETVGDFLLFKLSIEDWAANLFTILRNDGIYAKYKIVNSDLVGTCKIYGAYGWDLETWLKFENCRFWIY